MLIIYTANVGYAQERSWSVTGRNYGPDPWMTRWTLRDWDFNRRKLSEQRRNGLLLPRRRRAFDGQAVLSSRGGEGVPRFGSDAQFAAAVASLAVRGGKVSL